MRKTNQFLLVGIAGVQILAAGAAWASGSDASFLFYNPASLSMVESSDFSLSGVGILPTSSASYSNAVTSAGNATGGDATPSNFIENAIVPAAAARVRLTPELAWGVTVNVPWV